PRLGVRLTGRLGHGPERYVKTGLEPRRRAGGGRTLTSCPGAARCHRVAALAAFVSRRRYPAAMPDHPHTNRGAPFETLFETPSRGPVRGGVLPVELRRYGERLAIPLREDRPAVVVNFVSSLD